MNRMTEMQILAQFGNACKQFGCENFLELYRKHILPETVEELVVREYNWEDFKRNEFYTRFPDLSNFYLRSVAIGLQGFSLVTKKAAKDLAEYIGNRKCIEIMAGLGTWSYALQQEGIDIIATDIKKELYSTFSLGKEWTNVEKIDCVEAIKKYNNRPVVLCSWPRSDSPFVEAVKEALRKDIYAEVIHIGECAGGCCASEEQWEELYDYDIKSLHVYLQNWESIHDSVCSIKNNVKIIYFD